MLILRIPYPQQEQQFRRMVFNAVSRNIDNHTKNISYIMDNKGEWKLSPAYDLLIVAENMEIKKAKEIIQQVRGSVALWDRFAQSAGVN